MIISASRRTDIPAFYSEWFMNRIRAGFCTVPNPKNPKQVVRISLNPDDVDVIVFWTRNAKPLISRLDELDSRGLRYYFQYTVLRYPKLIDNKLPSTTEAIDMFKRLSTRVGKNRVIWRYDPILLTNKTSSLFHIDAFYSIARALSGYTRRVVISMIDIYNYVRPRLLALEEQGLRMLPQKALMIDALISSLARIAVENRMEILTCAEEKDMLKSGVGPGKCIDDMLINQLFNIKVSKQKDRNQRRACGCVVSRDIGMYNSCKARCVYCYAQKNRVGIEEKREQHDPSSPSLLGWHEASQLNELKITKAQLRLF